MIGIVFAAITVVGLVIWLKHDIARERELEELRLKQEKMDQTRRGE